MMQVFTVCHADGDDDDADDGDGNRCDGDAIIILFLFQQGKLLLHNLFLMQRYSPRGR